MSLCFQCSDGDIAKPADMIVLVACGCNGIEEITYCWQCVSHFDFEAITCWMCDEPLEMLAGPIPEGYYPPGAP